MTNLTTLQVLRGALGGEMERDPLPAAIAKRCAERAGKPITKKDTEALREQFPGVNIYIQKQMYGTTIGWYRHDAHESDADRPAWWTSVPTYGNSGSIQVSRARSGIIRWPTVEELTYSGDTKYVDGTASTLSNARYFSARDERNAERQALLAGPSGLERAAQIVDAMVMLRAELVGEIEASGLDQAKYIISKMLNHRTGEEFRLWEHQDPGPSMPVERKR